MKRYLAIFGFVFIGVIAGLIVRGIPIVLQVNAGGGIQADRNGDVNGDARLDMSDAIYLLLHIFRDGPQPVALAQGVPDNMGQLLEEITNPCRERIGRYVTHGDGTVTDTCTGLMWFETQPPDNLTWEQAMEFCEDLQFAGHSDWRLPTAEEMASLHQNGLRKGPGPEILASPWPMGINPAFRLPLETSFWTSTETTSSQVGAWSPEAWIWAVLDASRHIFRTQNKATTRLLLPVRTVQ